MDLNMFKKLYIIVFLLSLGLNLYAEESFFKDPLETWVKPDDPRFDPNSLGKELRLSWDTLEKEFEKNKDLRKEFYDLQQEYIKKYHELTNDPKANYLNLSKEFSIALIKWLGQKIGAIINDDALSQELAFIAFGSLARLEAGPVTDLEGAIVWNENYKDKETRNYLSFEIGNKIARHFESLIGHPLFGRKGFRLDESDASPFHLAPWAQNLSIQEAYCWLVKSMPVAGESDEETEFRKELFLPFEGSWAYASTPKALAKLTIFNYKNFAEKKALLEGVSSIFLDSNFIFDNIKTCDSLKDSPEEDLKDLTDKIRTRLLRREGSVASFFRFMQRNRKLIYGQEQLFDEFGQEINELLDKPYDNDTTYRQQIAKNSFRRLVPEFEDVGNGILVSGEIPGYTDIKRWHYRLEEQVLTNLSLYYNLGVQNTADIIEALKDKSLIGKEFAENIFYRINQLTRLRWKEQITAEEQLKTGYNFTDTNAYDKHMNTLNNEVESLDKIINNKDSTTIEVLAARYHRSELESLLRTMEKLKPLSTNSILDEKEVDLIKNKIIPGELDLLKRVKAFISGDENAFQDQE